MTTSAYQREYPIPPAFPAILKGFARETLRAQPQDIYKFAAQYFTELVASNPGPTADSSEEKAARLEADLLQQFLNTDRSNAGAIPFAEFKKTLHTRALALSSRQIRVAVANCDVNQQGVIEYRSCVPLLSKLLLKAKEADESPFGEANPELLRGWTSTDMEERFAGAFRSCDPDNKGLVSRQAFRASLQSPDLALCRKDVNALLGEMDPDAAELDYQSIVPEVYELLSARMVDEFAINEDISSQNALKEYLMRQAQQQDPQDTGVMPWENLLQTLQKLSQDCLGFTATDLACMLGYAAQDAAQVMQYSQAVPAVAAQVLSYINPRVAGTRLAAMNEYRQRDASEKKRGNEQLIQKCLTQAFEDEDKAGAGELPKQQCLSVVQSLTGDMLQLSPQEVVALRMVLQQYSSNSITCSSFTDQCCQAILHLAEEQYVQSYIQAHS